MGLLRKKPYLVNVALFFLTFLFTLYAGTEHFIAFHAVPIPENTGLLALMLRRPQVLLWGLPYSLSLMAILLFHEMGHYWACRHHRIRATLPYFLPAPSFTQTGTFGAFIKIQSPITSKKSLFDIGIAGPLAGFAVALPVIGLGLSLSKITAISDTEAAITLGEPLVFKLLARIVIGPAAASTNVLIHPIAFAGWFGLLATTFNLFPIGQLDGGHILYALFGNKTYYMGMAFVIILIILGILSWPGWLVWALLVSLIGYRHPPVYEYEKLDMRRKVLAAVPLLIFVLSFTPAPITISF